MNAFFCICDAYFFQHLDCSIQRILAPDIVVDHERLDDLLGHPQVGIK